MTDCYERSSSSTHSLLACSLACLLVLHSVIPLVTPPYPYRAFEHRILVDVNLFAVVAVVVLLWVVPYLALSIVPAFRLFAAPDLLSRRRRDRIYQVV